MPTRSSITRRQSGDTYAIFGEYRHGIEVILRRVVTGLFGCKLNLWSLLGNVGDELSAVAIFGTSNLLKRLHASLRV